jgi:hypothetical protein
LPKFSSALFGLCHFFPLSLIITLVQVLK